MCMDLIAITNEQKITDYDRKQQKKQSRKRVKDTPDDIMRRKK